MQFTGTYSKPRWKNTYLARRYNSKCYKVVGLQIMLQMNIPTLDTKINLLACTLHADYTVYCVNFLKALYHGHNRLLKLILGRAGLNWDFSRMIIIVIMGFSLFFPITYKVV